MGFEKVSWGESVRAQFLSFFSLPRRKEAKGVANKIWLKNSRAARNEINSLRSDRISFCPRFTRFFYAIFYKAAKPVSALIFRRQSAGEFEVARNLFQSRNLPGFLQSKAEQKVLNSFPLSRLP
jgi:hypothetical protein